MSDCYKTTKDNKYESFTDRLNLKVVNKIRKRIMSRQLMEGEVISEVQITKKEAEQLGEITILDGIKLIVVERLGDMTNKHCFGYIDKKRHKSCYCLNKLYCQNKECKFYRTNINISEIENSIKKYAIGR